MKILYIGVWKDSHSGWAKFAQNQILALDAAGVDVVPRHIKLNEVYAEIPKRISELEQKSDKNPTHIIFNTLPSTFEHTNKAKTIGYYLVETNNFHATNWSTRINSLDRAWVPCKHNMISSTNSNVNIPIDIVPMATDFSKFTQKYEPIALRKQFKDDFIFYYIGELTTRKNVESIIRAFHLEFSPNEPVQLLIKTTPTGLGNNPTETINNFLGNIKKGLRLYADINSYKKELVFCNYATDLKIQRLHSSCDCYVNVSHGESWCVPAFEAVGHCKKPIVGKHSGFLEWGNENVMKYIESYEEQVVTANDAALSDIYTGNEKWYDVDIDDLRRRMRMSFNERNDGQVIKDRLIAESLEHVYQYSYEKVGKLMKEKLEQI